MFPSYDDLLTTLSLVTTGSTRFLVYVVLYRVLVPKVPVQLTPESARRGRNDKRNI